MRRRRLEPTVMDSLQAAAIRSASLRAPASQVVSVVLATALSTVATPPSERRLNKLPSSPFENSMGPRLDIRIIGLRDNSAPARRQSRLGSLIRYYLQGCVPLPAGFAPSCREGHCATLLARAPGITDSLISRSDPAGPIEARGLRRTGLPSGVPQKEGASEAYERPALDLLKRSETSSAIT
jgi:hypothetical protein